MHFWLVRDLEPIPTDPGNRRQMRPALIAQALVDAGHSVRWITSSFDHYLKRQRYPARQEIEVSKGYTISVLPGRGYARNVSIARIRHNRDFARRFTKFAGSLQDQPDLIITDIPTTETAAAAVRYGQQNHIPTCVEIIDLWPDFFPAAVPRSLQWLARVAVQPMVWQARYACTNAYGLIGISPGYLQWGLEKAGRIREPRDGLFPLGYAPANLPAQSVAENYLGKLGISSGQQVVAFVGSWGQTYDLELIHRTAELLADRNDIIFVVAGSGDQGPAMKTRFAELPNVIAPGWIGPEHIAAILDRAAIGLLPYKQSAPQGLPNKVFEYLAFGTYQIATLRGELEQFYLETGAGISLGNGHASELAEKISLVLADDKLLAAKSNRKTIFETRYSANAIYSDLVVHLEAIARP